MAEKNIVREDVVSLSFEVENSELTKMAKEIDELKKTLTGGLDKGLDKAKDGLDDLKDSVSGVGQEGKKSTSFIDKMKASLGKLKDKITETGKAASGKLYQGLKKAASVSFKALATGIGAVATGLGVVLKQAVSAYGEFEQLKGGVETIFGAGGANSVEEYAKNVGKSVDEVKDKYKTLKDVEATVFKNSNDAYKTAGLSSNDYMNTVTSFSSSLIQSLNGDTVKAAEVANRAIIDMSDNANKMGTDMGLIQNAYQGFAKQNYTMLDNLKLGRLWKSAKKRLKNLFPLLSINFVKTVEL